MPGDHSPTEVRVVRPPRFLCRAAWRCVPCDTHWTATRTGARAVEQAVDHERERHDGR